jgi:hypothetical protein
LEGLEEEGEEDDDEDGVVERVLARGMGMNLVPGQGVYAGSGVTRGEYEGYVGGLVAAEMKGGGGGGGGSGSRSGGVLSETEAREACRDFFGHYAFQVPPGMTTTGGGGGATATTREACVYLLASLINHCCTPATTTHPSAALMTGSGKNRSGGGGSAAGPNCSWRIGPSGLAHCIKPRHICVQARRAIREGEQLTWDYGKQEKGFACECDTCRDSLMGGLGSVCGVL